MKRYESNWKLISSAATIFVLVIFLVGMAFFPVTKGFCAAAPTQTKTDGASKASPANTYTDESVEKLFEGKGIGKKTLSAVCKENKIDLSLAKKKLAKQKIQMKDDETLLDAAQKVSKSPIDLMKVILKGEPIKK